MKNQALFSSKGKRKELKCRLLQFLYGALRVKCLSLIVSSSFKIKKNNNKILLQDFSKFFTV